MAFPTVTLVPGADGTWQEWSGITGATYAWEAVAEDDSDTAYITLTTSAVRPTPMASFHFHGNSNLKPTRVVLTMKAKRVTGTAANGILGFNHYDDGPLEGVTFAVGATYTTGTKAYTTHPYTGAAFAPGDLTGLEVLAWCEKHPLASHPVAIRLSYLSVAVTYDPATYYSVEVN